MEKILGKLFLALMALSSFLHIAPVQKFSGSTITSVTCQSAFQAPMYDTTPSGHMQKGYMDADTGDTFSGDKGTYNGTTTTGLIGAHNLGTIGSWKRCTDQNGVTHEVSITNATYTTFTQVGGKIASSTMAI